MGEIWYDKPAALTAESRLWWTASKEEAHLALKSILGHLLNQQRPQREADLRHIRAYSNFEMLGLDPDAYARASTTPADAITYNVIESAIDTIHADVVAQRNKVTFTTDGGDYEQQERAKGLSLFASGQFREARIHEDVLPLTTLDAMVTGTGAMKVFRRNRRPCAERRLSTFVIADEVEWFNGKGRSLFEVDFVPREMLRGLLEDGKGKAAKLKLIKEAPRAQSQVGLADTVSDQVMVWEGWHLPSSPGADDGRHIISLETGTLVDESWTRDSFPWVFLRYKSRLRGFRGKGVAAILDGNQYAINELLWKIHEALRLAGPKIFVSPNAQMNTAHLDNEIWGIIETLTPPHMALFESVSPDLFRQLMSEIEQAYALVGVNVIAARSELPAGMQGASGKALRLYTDTKSKRFVKFAQAIEQAHVDLAELFVQEAAEIAEDDEPYEVRAKNDDGMLELVDWSKVNLDRDKYVIEPFPTSFFSSTPSARMTEVTEFLAMFPELKPFAMSLFDFPDLKAFTSLMTAGLQQARKAIEHMLKTGTYVSPEPFMDLAMCQRLGQAYYLDGKTKKMPAAKLKLLQKFTKNAKRLADRQQPAGAPPSPVGPGAPPAMPPGPMPGAPPV